MLNKKKTCKECGQEKYIFSKGLCQACASKNYTGLNKSAQIKSNSKKIKQSTYKQTVKIKKQKERRDVYFDYHIQRCTHSEESGLPISNPGKVNICHLLPKKSHPSVEDNLENCVYYSFKEHERFDYLLFSHRFEDIEKEFKNSYNIVWIRIKKVLSLIKETSMLSLALEKYLDGKGE